jgi:hypothetical protein
MKITKIPEVNQTLPQMLYLIIIILTKTRTIHLKSRQILLPLLIVREWYIIIWHIHYPIVTILSMVITKNKGYVPYNIVEKLITQAQLAYDEVSNQANANLLLYNTQSSIFRSFLCHMYTQYLVKDYLVPQRILYHPLFK